MGRGNLQNRRRSVAVTFLASAAAITYLAFNQTAPTASAGADVNATIPAVATIDASASVGATSYATTLVSGPTPASTCSVTAKAGYHGGTLWDCTDGTACEIVDGTTSTPDVYCSSGDDDASGPGAYVAQVCINGLTSGAGCDDVTINVTCTTPSAYYPTLCLDYAEDELNTRWAGYGTAIVPTPTAPPTGPLTDFTAATATAARDALQAGTGRRVVLTANVTGVTLSANVTDVTLDCDGFEIDSFVMGSAYVATRFRIENCQKADYFAFLSSARSADVSIVASTAIAGGSHPIYATNIDRFTVADFVARGTATTAAPVLLGTCTDVLIVNSALGAHQSATSNDWGLRDGAGGSDRVLLVNSQLQGGAASAALRQSHADGLATWSTPYAIGTGHQATIINLILPFSHIDLVATTLDTNHIGSLHTRYYLDDTDGTVSQAGIGAVTSQAGSLGWRIGDMDVYTMDATMLSDARLTTLDTAATAQGCDADYGEGTHSYTYADPVVHPGWPTRASYIGGITLTGNPYTL